MKAKKAYKDLAKEIKNFVWDTWEFRREMEKTNPHPEGWDLFEKAFNKVMAKSYEFNHTGDYQPIPSWKANGDWKQTSQGTWVRSRSKWPLLAKDNGIQPKEEPHEEEKK